MKHPGWHYRVGKKASSTSDTASTEYSHGKKGILTPCLYDAQNSNPGRF